MAPPREAASQDLSLAHAEPHPARDAVGRVVRRVFPLLMSGLILLLAAAALMELRDKLDIDRLADHLASLPAAGVAACLGLTMLSYVALVGYDVSALRWIGARVPLRRAALASFVGFAFSNTLSFTALSGGAVRYRLYTAAGLTGMEVAKAVFFLSTAFMVGVSMAGSVGLWLAPDRAAFVLRLPTAAVQGLAAGMTACVAVLLASAALRRAPITIRGRAMRLPSAGLLLTQLLISCADILFSGGALYALLPDSAQLSFPAFIGVYCAAIVLGLLSHVPGGIGVFDGVMLYAFADAVPADRMAAALLVYRAIYYLLPLILAGGLFARHEGRALRPALRGLARKSGLAVTMRLLRIGMPAIAAAVAVGAGIMLVASGALPASPGRVKRAAALVSLPLVEISHILNSVVGIGLILVGRALYRRLDSAWYMAMGLLTAGIVLSLLKGLDWEEASLLVAAMATLLATRREFYRRGALADVRLTPGWLLAGAGVLVGGVALAMFAFDHVEYRDSLWWKVAVSADAPRSLRALLSGSVVLLTVSLWTFLRPARALMTPPDPAAIDRAAAILAATPRTEGNIALLGDKALLFNPEGTAFLMYGVRGRSWIALGDPVGPVEAWPGLVQAFRALVDRQGGRIAFYQVRSESLPQYIDVGMLPVKIGEEALLPLSGFSLDGAARRDLRYAVNKGERSGLSFAVIPAAEVPPLLPMLRRVSDDWLDAKGVREKRFSVGRFDEVYLSRCDLAVVRAGAEIVAFANLWRGAPGGELSLDLMRHRSDAPGLTMDFLFARLLLWGAAQGYGTFNLGMAPLSGLADRPYAPIWQRLGGLLFTRGEPFYGFVGLRRYKEKFDPVWEPRYLCCPGGLAPATILADVAALVSGGLDGVVAR